MSALRAENFDVGYAEPMDYCGFGMLRCLICERTEIISAMFHVLGIKKIAIVLSIASFDNGAFVTGAPNMYSYVPGICIFRVPEQLDWSFFRNAGYRR